MEAKNETIKNQSGMCGAIMFNKMEYRDGQNGTA